MQLDKNRISTGSKNWIRYFFHLHEEGLLSIGFKFKSNSFEEALHYIFNKTGILYGTALSNLYTSQKFVAHLTKEEKLKLLLFENLFFVYQNHSKEQIENYDAFLESLNNFYDQFQTKIAPWEFDFDKKVALKLEKILSERVKIRSNITKGNYWLNQSANGLVFIDVLLYSAFLKDNKLDLVNRYDDFVLKLLLYLTKAAFGDGKIEDKEKRLLYYLLSSSHLNEKQKNMVRSWINKEAELNLKHVLKENDLDNKFIFELCIFVTCGTHTVHPNEERNLKKIGKALLLTSVEIDEAFLVGRTFVFKNKASLAILNEEKSSGILLTAIQKKWSLILGRNKEKLFSEIKESKELMDLIAKSAIRELRPEEKDQFKSQFYDILKSVPSLAIFLLPGGAILLPLVIKIFPDLLPTSFKENIISKKEPPID
ncbi:MAG: LETM1 domain-containing protein [Crocinitomicaceae bacterium]|nr:LETM1 domain-containing protein [Crocinitomicaceae bacterium]MDG1734214.1 LETM1 domain-containing protein [Crocinitomicaceae bacterium]